MSRNFVCFRDLYMAEVYRLEKATALESRLGALRDATSQRLPQFAEAHRRLFIQLAADVGPRARDIGDPAPDVLLRTAADDRPLRISWLLDQGPVVVVFYRGHWCPYSNVQLQVLQDWYGRLRSLGAELLFVGPETRASAQKMREKWHASLPVLYDADGSAMDAFRVTYEIPAYLREDYARLGFPDVNPGTSWRLPVTATYVIDQMNVIHTRHLDTDHTRRMEPARIIAALERFQRLRAA